MFWVLLHHCKNDLNLFLNIKMVKSQRFCMQNMALWYCCYCFNVTFFYQRTPLHFAAREGRKLTVESLVDKGANINIRDNSGVSIGCI